MKNIKLYESFRTKEDKGFALSVTVSGKDVTYNNILLFSGKDFYSAIDELADLLNVERDDLNIALDKYDLCEKITEVLFSDATDIEYTFWSGLEPSHGSLGQVVGLFNPYTAVNTINIAFTNGEQIFSKFPNGNAENLDYIYYSIERDPENLSRFIDDEHVVEFGELLHALKETNKLELLDPYFKRNFFDVHYLDRYPDIKKDLLKRTGLKDLGKLGKSMRDGLI